MEQDIVYITELMVKLNKEGEYKLVKDDVDKLMSVLRNLTTLEMIKKVVDSIGR